MFAPTHGNINQEIKQAPPLFIIFYPSQSPLGLTIVQPRLPPQIFKKAEMIRSALLFIFCLRIGITIHHLYSLIKSAHIYDHATLSIYSMLCGVIL